MALLGVIRRWALRDQLYPGDRAVDGSVAEHDPQASARGHCGAGVPDAGAAEQAGPLRRQAFGLAEDGIGEVAQEAANPEAVAR